MRNKHASLHRHSPDPERTINDNAEPRTKHTWTPADLSGKSVSESPNAPQIQRNWLVKLTPTAHWVRIPIDFLTEPSPRAHCVTVTLELSWKTTFHSPLRQTSNWFDQTTFLPEPAASELYLNLVEKLFPRRNSTYRFSKDCSPKPTTSQVHLNFPERLAPSARCVRNPAKLSWGIVHHRQSVWWWYRWRVVKHEFQITRVVCERSTRLEYGWQATTWRKTSHTTCVKQYPISRSPPFHKWRGIGDDSTSVCTNINNTPARPPSSRRVTKQEASSKAEGLTAWKVESV